ncbi:MAG: ABC transporter ATP-binding protein [SAR202 cluster bacterium]|nr:ABC transporter ATP-binding protein [SAR202 cluster bacterium]
MKSVHMRLIGYGWRQRGFLLGAYAAMAAATISGMYIPALLGRAIDTSLVAGTRGELLRLAAFIMLAGAFRGIFGYAQNYLAEAVSQRSAFDIRNDFFRKLQSLSFGFHDRQQTGNLMSKATADVDAVRMFISMGMIRGLSMFMMFGGVAFVMLTTNVRLGLVCLAFVPFIIWRAISMSKRLRGTWTAVQTETGNMTTVLQENLAGVRVVKVFGAQEYANSRFKERAGAVADLAYSASRLFASQGSLITFIFTAATGIILWVGGREIVAGRLSPGDIATFILYMTMLAMPVRMTGFLVNTWSRAGSAGQRIFDVLDAESPVTERPGAKSLDKVSGHVRFDGVSFSYNENASAIKGVDFEAAPGQLVAIMGAPGSGKSTIVQLIPRFYDVTSGRITIDGQDIRDLTLKSLRQNVGIVMQDVFVFGASVKDNIAYGAEGASLEDVIRAAKIAQLHDFIQTQPQGYNTWVGERGVRLSGGQRQRLAIARTLLVDPPVLILDDSTSSVDMGTEFQIQQALAEVIKGRTTFVIAHRLSTVRKADLVLVLDRGEIVERGTHEELLEKGGFYRKIYDMQLTHQDGADAPAAPTAAAGGG